MHTSSSRRSDLVALSLVLVPWLSGVAREALGPLHQTTSWERLVVLNCVG